MTPRMVGRWLVDWRNIAAVCAAALIAYLGVFIVATVASERQAVDAAKNAALSEREARQAAVHRIDQLLAKIDALQRTGLGNSEQLALLRAEVVLLARQVRDLGGQPVIIAAGGGTDGTPSPSASPSASRSPRPHPRPSPTATHTPSPAPSRTCIVAGICVR